MRALYAPVDLAHPIGRASPPAHQLANGIGIMYIIWVAISMLTNEDYQGAEEYGEELVVNNKYGKNKSYDTGDNKPSIPIHCSHVVVNLIE